MFCRFLSSYEQMYNFTQFLQEIPPLVIVPYTIIVFLVLANFIYEKYVIRRTIIHLSSSKDWEDVNRLKNLRVNSLVYSFIIILIILEFVINSMFESAVIMKNFYPFPPLINVSNSCLITDYYLLSLMEPLYLTSSYIFNISIIIGTSLLPIISLFFIILRRTYINYPYRQYVRKYIVLFVLRFIGMAILDCFMQTWYFVQLLLLVIFFVDVKIYFSSSRQFYLLLKGLRNEARIHSTKLEYIEKSRTVNQFFYAQVVSIFLLSVGFGVLTLYTISVPLRIYGYNPCFLSYITFGYIPNIRGAIQAQATCRSLVETLYVIQSIALSIIEIAVILVYLAIIINIVKKLIKRQRAFNQVNTTITRPLIYKYKNTF